MNLPIRDSVKCLCDSWKKLPEFAKIITAIVIFVGSINLLTHVFGWIDLKLMDFCANRMKEQTFGSAFKAMVIQAPIKEEFDSRGPAFALMLFLVGAAKLMRWWKKEESPLEYKFFGKISLIDCAVWPMLLAYNYPWAMDHAAPASVFAFGLVLGWIMLKTKSIFSLLYCVGIHAAANLMIITIAKSGFSAVYN